MNIMIEVISRIYIFGNAIVEYQNENFKTKIIFYIGTNNKLNISIEKYCEINGVDMKIANFKNISAKEGFQYIVLLFYYTLDGQQRLNDHLTISNIQNYNFENAINAINELYQQFLPMLSEKRDYIENLVKSRNLYDSVANQTNYVEYNSENSDYVSIITTLNDKYQRFYNALSKEYINWRTTSAGLSSELNKSKKIELSDKDLDVINIYYEFLTNKEYTTDPAEDREEIIENLEIALLTNSKSAILVGSPGVGKTAITEGLAYRIIRGTVPNALKSKRILKINVPSIVSGCTLVGMFEAKVEKIMNYLTNNPDVILFLDGIHTAIGAGTGSHSNIDLANIIKPYIDRGNIKIIGATTEEEYEKYIKMMKHLIEGLKK